MDNLEDFINQLNDEPIKKYKIYINWKDIGKNLLFLRKDASFRWDLVPIIASHKMKKKL